jgi:DNA-binding transcriptional LysR family regulator
MPFWNEQTMDTLRAMRVFIRTVELGSLSSAARELHTTQPSVSKLLAQLEQQLGARLLERSTRGLTPTEQGQRFYRDAKAVLEQFDTAVGGLQGMTGQPRAFYGSMRRWRSASTASTRWCSASWRSTPASRSN